MPQEIVYIQRDDTKAWFTGAVIVHAFLFLFNAFFFYINLEVLLTDSRVLPWKVTPFVLTSYHLAVLVVIPVALAHMYRARKMKLWHIALVWYALLFFACASLWVWIDSAEYMGLVNLG